MDCKLKWQLIDYKIRKLLMWRKLSFISSDINFWKSCIVTIITPVSLLPKIKHLNPLPTEIFAWRRYDNHVFLVKKNKAFLSLKWECIEYDLFSFQQIIVHLISHLFISQSYFFCSLYADPQISIIHHSSRLLQGFPLFYTWLCNFFNNDHTSGNLSFTYPAIIYYVKSIRWVGCGASTLLDLHGKLSFMSDNTHFIS